MSGRSASCSDLELASFLSRRLGAPAAAPSAPVERPYTRFSAAVLGAPAPRVEPAPPAPKPTPELRAFASWKLFLAWAQAECNAKAAFVIDPEGFAIATVGDLDDEQAQALGVHLMVALWEADQPEHIGSRARVLAVEYPQFSITALRVARNEGAMFTFVFVANEIVPSRSREAIVAQAVFNLEHL